MEDNFLFLKGGLTEGMTYFCALGGKYLGLSPRPMR